MVFRCLSTCTPTAWDAKDWNTTEAKLETMGRAPAHFQPSMGGEIHNLHTVFVGYNPPPSNATSPGNNSATSANNNATSAYNATR